MATAIGPVMKLHERGAGARPALCVLAALLAAAGAAHAQSTTRIAPTLDTRLTWTDNVAADDRDKRSDWVLEVSPGVSMLRESGRLKGRFSVQARSFAYAEETERNTTYLSVLGRGEFEAVQRLLFVEADARVSRGDMSSLRGRAAGDSLNNDKSNETRIWSIGPRLHFNLGSAEGLVRYQSRWVSGGRNTFGDQQIDRWQARLGDPSAVRLLGWQADYERTDTDYEERRYRALSEEIARATLFVNLSPQLRLRAIVGYESNDYLSARGDDGEFFGAGFDWRPTPRTRISALGEDRVLGRTYDAVFSHRMPRVAWDFRLGNDVSSSAQALARGYEDDPLFQVILNSPGLISEYSDPLEREQAARRLYDAAYGDDVLLSNAYYMQRSAQARMTLFGVRNMLSFSLQRNRRSALSQTGDEGRDDLAGYDNVDTRSGTLSFSHRLSGRSTLTAAYTHSKSEGRGARNLQTERRSAAIGVATRLGPRTTGSLSLRHQNSDGGSDYTENAVIAHLGMRF